MSVSDLFRPRHPASASRPVVGIEFDGCAVHAVAVVPGRPATLVRYVRAALPGAAVHAGAPRERRPAAAAVSAVAAQFADLMPYRTAVAVGGETTRVLPTAPRPARWEGGRPDVLMSWVDAHQHSGATAVALASTVRDTVGAVEDSGLDVAGFHLTALALADAVPPGPHAARLRLHRRTPGTTWTVDLAGGHVVAAAARPSPADAPARLCLTDLDGPLPGSVHEITGIPGLRLHRAIRAAVALPVLAGAATVALVVAQGRHLSAHGRDISHQPWRPQPGVRLGQPPAAGHRRAEPAAPSPWAPPPPNLARTGQRADLPGPLPVMRAATAGAEPYGGHLGGYPGEYLATDTRAYPHSTATRQP